jgi:ABC-type dipeptide/oligopeptide/nickel transport system permease subunit
MRILLIAITALLLAPELWVRHSYAEQFREHPSEPPSAQFWLGTDELGRDRFARLIRGSRISLLLAPSAAAVSLTLALILGSAAAWAGAWARRVLSLSGDLTLCLPWILLLMTVRAALPLDLAPAASLAVTFLLLGVLGWAGPARVVQAEVRRILATDHILRCRASGIPHGRVLLRHVLPGLAPVLRAQFWIAVPLFILSEANLGLLGLGVSEPLPSWGGLLKDLASNAMLIAEPWRQPWLLAPLALQVSLLLGYQLLFTKEESNA